MKLAINASAAPSTSPPPQPPTTPPPAPTPETTTSPAPTPKTTPSPAPATSPAPSPSTAPKTYVVGDSLGWTVPPGGAIAYRTWASNKTFSVGDVLVFNFTTNQHNVVSLTSKAAFDSCNATRTTPITTGPARITLGAPGEHYYICAFTGHCAAGQKLAINVTGTASTPASTPSPSGATTPAPSNPSTPSTPSPPPPNSAPSFAGAALPITFLAAALAFFF